MKKAAAKKIMELMVADQNIFIMDFTDPAV